MKKAAGLRPVNNIRIAAGLRPVEKLANLPAGYNACNKIGEYSSIRTRTRQEQEYET
jgi:hypothetical protein